MKGMGFWVMGATGTLALSVPYMAFAAQASFFGPVVPGGVCACPHSAPDFGCIMQLVQNLMNFGVSISVVIAVLIIAYAGALWMLSPFNPQGREMGRTILLNAVVGILIVLSAWLVVDFIMKAFYSGPDGSHGAFGPWNQIIQTTGGDQCLTPKNPQGLFSGGLKSLGDAFTSSGVPTGGILGSGSVGACSPGTVQSAAAGAGVTMSNAEANTFACLARYESACGSTMQNYKWGNGSSAFGAFQVTLDGNSSCYDNTACSQAAGVSGPLNCTSAFKGGNPIQGNPLVQKCMRAAANLGCSAAAAHCVLVKQGFSAWTADNNSSGQQACINQNT